MLYRVELWIADTEGRGFKLVRSEVCGNLKTARLTAAKWLPEQSETTYSARWARHPWVDVWQIVPCKDVNFPLMARAETIETPICYVPSVGDLGYTP